jgi:hypothetical protein
MDEPRNDASPATTQPPGPTPRTATLEPGRPTIRVAELDVRQRVALSLLLRPDAPPK